MGFARREGSGGIVLVNLYAFRATDPRNLPSGSSDNATAIESAIQMLIDGAILPAAYAAAIRALNEAERAGQ